MIARLLISPHLETRVEEIEKQLNQAVILNEAKRSEGSLTNVRTHPDILYFKAGEKLGIEQARKIKEHFSLKPYSAKGRVVALENASALTIEAQNALLKILEEPPKDALILLGAKSEADLLPTVLSRCQIVILNSSSVILSEAKDIHSSPTAPNDIKKLIDSSIEERFEYIEKLKEREEFLHALVHYFHQQLLSHIGSGNSNQEFLKELLQAEQWAVQNVNIRAILEYLMLVMPKTEK